MFAFLSYLLQRVNAEVRSQVALKSERKAAPLLGAAALLAAQAPVVLIALRSRGIAGNMVLAGSVRPTQVRAGRGWRAARQAPCTPACMDRAAASFGTHLRPPAWCAVLGGRLCGGGGRYPAALPGGPGQGGARRGRRWCRLLTACTCMHAPLMRASHPHQLATPLQVAVLLAMPVDSPAKFRRRGRCLT